jgi:hypothetical protein
MTYREGSMLARLASLAIVGALVTAAVSACSLILDTGNLPTPDGAPDARFDADPSMLRIESVEPMVIHEGVGTGGGRPAQIFVDAPNLIAGATIEIAWEDAGLPEEEPDPELVDSVVSGGRQAIGLSIRVPELATLDEGATRAILVTVTQSVGGGPISATFTVDVKGHAPFVATDTIDTDALDPARIYSSISFPVATRATGELPLVLRTVGPVTLEAAIDVSGIGAAGTGGPGAGGCIGGTGGEPLELGGRGQAGACGDGGGTGGDSGANGGGGGYGTEGNGGAGIGGAASGVAMLVPLAPQPAGPNHGNGGGGGGAGSLGVQGGDGGHGGGVVAIFASGRITVGNDGRVTASGGEGTAGGGGVTPGGAGGGGSGGAILLHSDVGIEGGTGILATASGGASDGGNPGGVGRIRIDNPAGTRTTNPTATYGASWPTNAPTIVRDDGGRITTSLVGTNGCYGFKLTRATLDAEGAGCGGDLDRALPGEVELQLSDAGLNRLCVRWTATATAEGVPDGPETETCIDVVYLQAD